MGHGGGNSRLAKSGSQAKPETKQPVKRSMNGLDDIRALTVPSRNCTVSFHWLVEEHMCMKETLAEGALQRIRVPVDLRSSLHSHFLVAMVAIQPMANMPRDPFVWMLPFSTSLPKGCSEPPFLRWWALTNQGLGDHSYCVQSAAVLFSTGPRLWVGIDNSRRNLLRGQRWPDGLSLPGFCFYVTSWYDWFLILFLMLFLCLFLILE